MARSKRVDPEMEALQRQLEARLKTMRTDVTCRHCNQPERDADGIVAGRINACNGLCFDCDLKQAERRAS